MLNFRSAPSPENSPNDAGHGRDTLDTRHAGLLIRFAPTTSPLVRRRLTRENGRALEMLGHAIEYLADEYAADVQLQGPLGWGGLGRADPRVEAIQVLKALNRAVYYSGTEIQPVFRRIRRWFIGKRGVAPRSRQA